MGGTRATMPTTKGTRSREIRSRTNAPAERLRRAWRTPMPETTNSKGMPQVKPHRTSTSNPGLGRGSFTNHEPAVMNTMAEWNTTKPATTKARMKSSSGRRCAEGEGAADKLGAPMPRGAGAVWDRV